MDIQTITARLKAPAKNGKRSFFVDIMDFATGEYIMRKVDQHHLDAHHNGDLNELLNGLAKQYNKLQIYPRRSNGSGSKAAGPAITISAESKANQPILATPVAAPTNQVGLMGLSGPEIMANFSDARLVPELKARILRLETELQTTQEAKRSIKDKNNKLEMKLERLGYKSEILRPPSALDTLLNGLAENPQSIPAILKALKPQTAGLAGAMPEQGKTLDLTGLNELKTVLVNCVISFPDQINNLIYTTYKGYEENNQEFTTKFETLFSPLKKVNNG